MIDDLNKQVKARESKIQHEKDVVDDEKAKCSRGAYTYTRMPHVMDGIGYVEGAKHNARENKNGKEFLKFTKKGSYQKKQAKNKNINHLYLVNDSHANMTNATCALFYDFDASYVLMRNMHGRVFAKYVGPCNKRPKACVWVPKVLVTNVKGPKQIWVPKNKA